MKQTGKYLFAAILVFLFALLQIYAGEAPKAPTQGEIDFYTSAVLPAMNKIKKAMPPAPAGWVVADETKIESVPQSAEAAANQSFHFTYQIRYKRIAGIKEEKKKLNDAYTESSERHGEEANPLIEEMLNQQTETSLALRKATRRMNKSEMNRLNEELEENGRKMRAIHEDVDNKIARDLDQYLVKDAEAVIDIAVDDERAEALSGESVSVPGAAFAFRWEGKRAGPALWKEGRTMILYGDWQQMDNGVFRGGVQHTPQNRKAQTIKIIITGDKNRVEELLKQMDRKAILSLMK